MTACGKAVVETVESLLSLTEVIKIHFSEDGAGPMIQCDIVIVNPVTSKKDTISAHCRVAGIEHPRFEEETIVRLLTTGLRAKLRETRKVWLATQSASSRTINDVAEAIAAATA